MLVRYWHNWLPDWLVRLHGHDDVLNGVRWPNLTESAILVYVISFCLQELHELSEAGIRRYASDMWNAVDLASNLFYLLWFAMRIVSVIQMNWSDKERLLVHKGFAGPGIEGESMGSTAWNHWSPYDARLLSEGFFAAANVLSFIKLIHVFSVHPHLGPLQISLGRMVFDIIKFFFVYTWIVFAFGCGLHFLLSSYAIQDRDKCMMVRDGGAAAKQSLDPGSALEQDHSCTIWRRFSNLFETTQTLFWASFGLIDLTTFEMTGIQEFTRFWALLMFGSYSIINVVVLLNLLIAMMSDSYQLISSSRDTEWKFARSKLWISFFEDDTSIRPAPPFNLIPSLDFIVSPIRRLCCLLCCCGCGSSSSSKSRNMGQQFDPNVESGSQAPDHSQHEHVMRSLVRRYVTREQRKAEETGPVTEDDVKEIKQDIASFRFELFDLLRDNGFKSSHVNAEHPAAAAAASAGELSGGALLIP